jgi:hypothetical protein
MNQLQALAMNEGQKWKQKTLSEAGRAQMEKFQLAPRAIRRRQDSSELLGRMNPPIQELTAAVEQEAKKSAMCFSASSERFCLSDGNSEVTPPKIQFHLSDKSVCQARVLQPV